MHMPLQHLLQMPDDLGAYEPLIERTAISDSLRQPKTERDELQAKAKTTAVLLSHGMRASIDDQEELVANQEFHKHLQQLPITSARVDKPGIVLKLSALLSEYDHQVVKDAIQMRQYVTNRLLEESDPKMPASQRMRALENLGKITEVGLFTERTEITVKNMPVENLESKLYDRLRMLLPNEENTIDVTPQQEHTNQ